MWRMERGFCLRKASGSMPMSWASWNSWEEGGIRENVMMEITNTYLASYKITSQSGSDLGHYRGGIHAIHAVILGFRHISGKPQNGYPQGLGSQLITLGVQSQQGMFEGPLGILMCDIALEIGGCKFLEFKLG